VKPVSGKVEIFFDYRSPFAYLLHEVLPGADLPEGTSFEWRPIDLLQLESFSGGLPYTDKKRAYVFVDVTRQAAFHGIETRMPQPFPVESELALRVALVAGAEPGFPAVHGALFRAAWREQRDLASEEVLGACLREGGLDPEPWLARARSEESRSLLARCCAEADAAGVFGVPTLRTGDELFWGLDSLPVLAWRLRGSPAPAA
jgi:2-hydroxychromene-2-carboxylate isomerase